MNYKRIGRALMCLVLICCLMVQTVPRVDATGAALAAPIVQAAGVTISAPVALTAMAISLGVMAGTNDDFRNLVQTAASSGLEWVKDGTVELLRTVDALGNQAFYVAGEFLESLRQGLFSSGAVSYSPGLTYAKECSFTGGGMTWELSCSKPVSIVCFNYYLTEHNLERSKLYLVVPHTETSSAVDVSVYTPHDGNTKKVTLGFVNDYFRYSHLYTSYDGYLSSFSGMTIDLGSTTDLYISDSYMKNNPVFSASMSSPYDLTLGQISTVPIDGTSALDWAPEYQANRLKVIEGGNDPDPDSDPPNDGKWFWPLALTATTAELLLMSQADQWSGESSPEFGDYTTGTEFEIVSRPEFEGDQQLELAPLTNPEPGTGTNPDPDVGGDPGGDFGEQPDYTSWFRRIIELMEELLDRFKTWCTDCKTAIEELPSKFAKWFDNICETLGNIWEWCQNLVSSLIDALQNLLSALFAPSADFIPNKVSALVAKYPYLETFTGLGTSLKAFFLNLGSKPPIIYIDLGAATGSYFFGGRQAFIDLTWYSDYKPTMDAILGAFIWLWLAWRVFHALPGIINGMSGTVGDRVSYSGTQNINLPPLPPQNELPPGHNRRM